MKFGPIEINVRGSKGSESYHIDLSDIPAMFHKIPGATDILSEVFQEGLNRYQLFNRMVKRDSALDAATKKMAMLVQRAYKGIILHPGDTEDAEEEEFLKEVRATAEMLQLKKIFYSAGRRLCIDGNVIIHKKRFSNKMRLDFQPMGYMTAIRAAGDLHTTNYSDLYSGPINWYVYDEGGSAEHKYAKRSIIHISMGNEADEVEDNYGRNTWGMWAQSPVEALRPEVYWRMSAMVNDMVWRRLYLPREHHEIDLTDLLDLNKYEGDTVDVRRAAAMTAVAKAIDAYIANMKGQMPDQGYVTPKVGDISAVTIKIIEPKSTNYVSPNQLLGQLASSVASSFFTRLSSETSASFAAEHIIASDTQVAAEYIAGLIKDEMLTVLKDIHRESAHVDKIDIRLQLILPKDMETLVRESAVLRASGVVLIDEIRVNYLGLDPLTKEQRELLKEEQAMTSSGSAGTMDQVNRDFVRRKDDEEQGTNKREQTGDSRHQNQLT